jgi:hypothetical protein
MNIRARENLELSLYKLLNISAKTAFFVQNIILNDQNLSLSWHCWLNSGSNHEDGNSKLLRNVGASKPPTRPILYKIRIFNLLKIMF